jgi:hypothetical protein
VELDRFDNGSYPGNPRIDSPKFRAKVQIVRFANNAGRGRPIADDTWSSWRSMSGAPKGLHSFSQKEAAIVCWIAFYPFSGKPLNDGTSFKGIEPKFYEMLTDQWLRSVEAPQILKLLRWVRGEAPVHDRPQRQWFVRQIQCRTVLRPARQSLLTESWQRD